MMNRHKRLLIISILLVGLLALTQSLPCERGRSEYSGVFRSRCVRCKCPKGYQLSKDEDIPYDKVLGALQCPNCTRCVPSYYSNARTDFVCVECSTPCEERRRQTLVPCNGMVNVLCGTCKEGYYERLEGDVSCTVCHGNTDRPECVGKVTAGSAVLPTNSTTETAYVPDKERNENKITGSPPITESTPSSHGSHMILVILCGVVLIFGIVVTLCLIKFIPKCCTFSQWSARYLGSNSTCSNGLSGSLLKGGLPNNDLEIDAVPIQYGECKELERETSRRMETTVVQRDDSLLRNIATKIDREPEGVFQELGIGGHVLFQERENQRIRGLHTSEYYLAVLQKWAEKNHRQATQIVLYRAFHKAHMHIVCNIISSDLNSRLIN